MCACVRACMRVYVCVLKLLSDTSFKHSLLCVSVFLCFVSCLVPEL